VDALEHNEPEQALAYGEEALALAPEDGEVWFQQSRVLRRLGRLEDASQRMEEAACALRQLQGQQPENIKLLGLLARVEQESGNIAVATEISEKVLSLDPNHLPTLLTYSRLLAQQGQADGAMPWLMNALAVNPDNPRVLSMVGQALQSIGETPQAIDLLRQALDLNPTLVEACFCLGACLGDLGLYGEAEAAFRQGLATAPQDLDCRMNLAGTLSARGRMAEAVAIYLELLAEVPDAQGAFNNLMFTYSISDLASSAEVLTTAHRFWSGLAQEGDKRPTCPAMPRAQRDVPRVGLLSADIGNHVVGRFLDPLLRHHDPQRCALEVVSMHRRYEESAEELIAMADGFHTLEGLPKAEGRARLQQLGYDLIVDTSGFTRGSGLHLLRERCAPVQAHYIGYHATTGLATIDWFIGDGETAAPELQEQFRERLWRLERPWLAYPSQMSFPEATALMATDRPVLGAFCQVPKMSATTLTFWAEALRATPEAVLVLKDRGLQDPGVRTMLEQALAEREVEPGRVVFMPPVGEWSDHVDLYNVIDVALDTTPWSSATTAFEALAMGIPLVAIRGGRMSARMSSSVVKGLGKPEWVAETPEAFAGVVSELCSDLPSLRAGKAARQQAMKNSVLFDGADLADKVVDAFLGMIQEGNNPA
jgi:predicted O-linked N-acetylglucosamine transferase (SPINDLY family)